MKKLCLLDINITPEQRLIEKEIDLAFIQNMF